MKNIISLDKVTVIKKRKTVLDNISWDVKKGESWAVVGKNGAGKSFLLRLIALNHYPSSGRVSVFGRQIGEVNIWDLKNRIGFVSDLLQEEYSVNITVNEVVYSGFFSSIGLYYPVDENIVNKTEKILELLRIEHIKLKKFKQLSHGEQRKVLIARALVSNPQLLILDEPCTGLDIPGREEFLKTLQKLLNLNINIIFVTHHIEEIIPEINNVMLLKNGKILHLGTKQKVLNKENLNSTFDHNFEVIERNNRYWTII